MSEQDRRPVASAHQLARTWSGGRRSTGDRSARRSCWRWTTIVATVVVGQLWGLTVALNAYFEERMTTVWWLLVFQCVSFLLALVVWLIVPDDRDHYRVLTPAGSNSARVHLGHPLARLLRLRHGDGYRLDRCGAARDYSITGSPWRCCG